MARLLSDVQSYELMLIFLHDLGEAEISKKVSEFKKLVEDAGGKVTAEDNWGMRDLSYKIKRRDRGVYYVLNFDLEDRTKINELNKTLLLDNVVVRHLLTKTPANYQLKTFKEYEVEAKEIEKLEEKVKEEKKAEEEKRTARKPIVKEKRSTKKAVETKRKEAATEEITVAEEMPKTEITAPVVEKTSEAEAPVATETAEEKPSKKKPKEELDDLDEKLKKIMDNPDITI